MFRLYGFIHKPELIAIKDNEEDIIKILSKIIYKNERIQYSIISNQGYGDMAKSILSEKDYLEYIQEYVKNNKPLTRRLKK